MGVNTRTILGLSNVGGRRPATKRPNRPRRLGLRGPLPLTASLRLWLTKTTPFGQRLLITEIPDRRFAIVPVYASVPTSCQKPSFRLTNTSTPVFTKDTPFGHMEAPFTFVGGGPIIKQIVTERRPKLPWLFRKVPASPASFAYVGLSLDVLPVGKLQDNITLDALVAGKLVIPPLLVKTWTGKIPHLLFPTANAFMPHTRQTVEDTPLQGLSGQRSIRLFKIGQKAATRLRLILKPTYGGHKTSRFSIAFPVLTVILPTVPTTQDRMRPVAL